VVVLLAAGCKDLLGIEEGIVGADAVVDEMVVVDMPIDQPAPLDSDSDGIAEDLDNCPAIANPLQHDFDSDSRGDVCDPCPHLGSQDADMDDDGDSVGAGCDPRPLVGGDQRVLFVTFDNASDIAGWSQDGGIWSVSGGTLNQTDSTGSPDIALPGSFGNGYFATRAEITVVGGAPFAGICSHVTLASDLCCDLVGSATAQSAYAIAEGGAAQAGTTWLPTPFVAGQKVDFEQRTDVSNFRCTWRSGSSTRDQTLNQARMEGNLTLHLRGMAARFEFVFFARVP
jgi:hypothetical protein